MTDEVETLRAQLAGLTGAARMIPALRIGQELAKRYHRLGPGSPTALPTLHDAVDALNDAYRCAEPGDLLRGQIAALLGWLLGLRHTVHGGDARDRDTGIHVLEEATGFTALPPAQAGMAKLVLGQLYLARATEALKGGGLMMGALGGGFSPGAGGASTDAADADRAAHCFQQVIDDEPFSAEMTGAAETMLTMAEALRTILGGVGQGPAGVDFGRLMEAMAKLQDMQRRAASGGFGPRGPGMPAMPSFLDADRIIGLDPLDRPVAVLRGTEPASPGVAKVRTSVTVDAEALRRSLPSTVELLDAPPSDVDALVATATTIVHSGAVVAHDHLRLAAALLLRDRRGDGDGWGDGTGSGDAEAAVDSLRAAATPDLPAGDVAVLLRLAVELDALSDVAGRFQDVAPALRAIGAGALVYPGLAVVDAATGRPGPVGPLPSRVLIVGTAVAVGDDLVASLVPTDTAVVALAALPSRPVGADAVFVANPRGDREADTMEVIPLRRAFHPRSTGLGTVVESVGGAGTPAEVLARLDASLLHLGCGVTADGALELAGPALLDAATIAASRAGAGGLVIVPPVGDGLVPLAEALLAAGLAGVVGWRGPVRPPDALVALVHFVLHGLLADDGLEPARAVHETKRWLRDPDRKHPPSLPDHYAQLLGSPDLGGADLVHWER